MDQDVIKSKLLESFEERKEGFKDNKDIHDLCFDLGSAHETLFSLYVILHLIDHVEYERLENELDVAYKSALNDLLGLKEKILN